MYSFYQQLKILFLTALFLFIANEVTAQCSPSPTLTSTVPTELFVCDPNGTFTVTLDFADLPAGTTATIELSDIAGVTYVSSGTVVGADLDAPTPPILY